MAELTTHFAARMPDWWSAAHSGAASAYLDACHGPESDDPVRIAFDEVERTIYPVDRSPSSVNAAADAIHAAMMQAPTPSDGRFDIAFVNDCSRPRPGEIFGGAVTIFPRAGEDWSAWRYAHRGDG